MEVFVVCDSFPPSIIRTPTYELWKYVIIVCFCQSSKQPSTPLEWFKCSNHGWVHAQDCLHKHINGHSESKVHFYLYWWSYHYGLLILAGCSCVPCWWLEAQPYFIDLGVVGQWWYNRSFHKVYNGQCVPIWGIVKIWLCFKFYKFWCKWSFSFLGCKKLVLQNNWKKKLPPAC